MYGMSRLKKVFPVVLAFLVASSICLTSIPVHASTALSSKQKNAITALLKVVDPSWANSYFGKSTKISKTCAFFAFSGYAYFAAGNKKLYGYNLIRPYKIIRNSDEMDAIVYTKNQVSKILKGIFGKNRKISYSGIKTNRDKCYSIYEEPSGCHYKVYGAKALKDKSIVVRASAYDNSDEFVENIQMTIKPSTAACFGYYIVEIKKV